jgi:UDP-N-acetylglucosamine acyltransferase
MNKIHATALVDASARLGSDVEVGPYSVVGPEVELGEGVVLQSHVVVTGRTRLGKGCQVFPFASIGHMPQDMKYRGEESRLEVGDHTTIREHVTINPGTEGGGMVTRIGSHCLLMVGAHVAHDCTIGDHVILVNNATLGGHVTIGEYAILGGLSAVHQYVRIGAYAFIGGMSGIPHDVIPFGMAIGAGRVATLAGLNLIGLKRHEFPREEIHELRQAYRLLFSTEGTLKERLIDVDKLFSANLLVKQIIDFMRTETDRSYLPGNASPPA